MEDLATKLAAALLLKEGEISVSDIEALPFVDDEQAAFAVAHRLLDRFDTYTSQRRVETSPGRARWEDVIILRSGGRRHKPDARNRLAAAASAGAFPKR